MSSDASSDPAPSREPPDPVVHDVVDEERREYRRDVALVVAAVVGGGLMVIFALGMAGFALLAPATPITLSGLGLLGVGLSAVALRELLRGEQ